MKWRVSSKMSHNVRKHTSAQSDQSLRFPHEDTASLTIQNTLIHITKTRLFKNTENFTNKKNEIFQIKNSNIFHISAQNIDYGYSLKPPRRGGSNEYPQSMF